MKRPTWVEFDCPDCTDGQVVVWRDDETVWEDCDTCAGRGVLEPPEADDNYDGPVDHSWDDMDADYECYPEVSR